MLNLKKGRLLISEPSLIEPAFFKSIILITHHSDDESIGVVLNQKTKINLKEIITNIAAENFPVYIGGPVERDTIHFIHTLGDIIPNTQKIMEGLYWGGDFNTIVTLINKKRISKDEVRFFAGYSGWGENQLNNEIRENGWIIHKSNPELCMQYSNEKLWSDLIKTKKSKYAIWTNMPRNPSLN